MSDEIEFLVAVRDGGDIFPLVKKIGYGWALEEGLIRNIAPLPAMDFVLTEKGEITLNAFLPSSQAINKESSE